MNDDDDDDDDEFIDYYRLKMTTPRDLHRPESLEHPNPSHEKPTQAPPP
jgi:hypothetical protein